MQNLSHFFEGIALRDVKRVYRISVPRLKAYWRQFILAYLALFAAMIMNLLKPWPLKFIFDYVLLNKPVPHRFTFLSDMAGHEKLTILALSCAGIVGIFFLEGFFITPGDLIVFISYLRDLYRPVGGISELIIDFSSSLVCGRRVAEILETKISVADAPDATDAPPSSLFISHQHKLFTSCKIDIKLFYLF